MVVEESRLRKENGGMEEVQVLGMRHIDTQVLEEVEGVAKEILGDLRSAVDVPIEFGASANDSFARRVAISVF